MLIWYLYNQVVPITYRASRLLRAPSNYSPGKFRQGVCAASLPTTMGITAGLLAQARFSVLGWVLTVYIRGPIKGYIQPYDNYYPTVTEGGQYPRVLGFWIEGFRV